MTVQELIDALRRFPPNMPVFIKNNNYADEGISLFDPYPMLRTVGRSRGLFADGPDYTVEEVHDPGGRLQHLKSQTGDQEILVL